jgi:hypothetical protein
MEKRKRKDTTICYAQEATSNAKVGILREK